MRSPYYCYQGRMRMAGLTFRHDADSKFHDVAVRVGHSEPFPEGYECHEPVFIGSPKPRFYDMASDIIVSEKLAEVLDREAGNKIRLMPLHYTPDPKSKFPATGKYFFLWVPKIDCLEYVYGDPLPTSDYFRKKEIKAGRTPPETERPLLQLNLNMEVAAEFPMFRLGGIIYKSCFMTEKIMEACKAEKIYAMHLMPYQEDLELSRRIINTDNGIEYLLYNLPPAYGYTDTNNLPQGVTREYLLSLLPPK